MTDFSPKATFQTLHPALAKELQANRLAPWLVIGFAYSLAEMANLGATAEQLNGARNFIATLQNLWETGEPAKRLPAQRLETFERPIEELLEDEKARQQKEAA